MDWTRVNYRTKAIGRWVRDSVAHVEHFAGPYQVPLVLLREMPDDPGEFGAIDEV